MGHLRRTRLHVAAQVHSHPGKSFPFPIGRRMGNRPPLRGVVAGRAPLGTTVAKFMDQIAVYRLSRRRQVDRDLDEDYGARVMLNAKEEDPKVLASLLGIEEEEAAEKLQTKVTVTVGNPDAATFALRSVAIDREDPLGRQKRLTIGLTIKRPLLAGTAGVGGGHSPLSRAAASQFVGIKPHEARAAIGGADGIFRQHASDLIWLIVAGAVDVLHNAKVLPFRN